MLEFVNELLKSQDNIIDQLKLLKENENNREVKKYMRVLVEQNDSPYFKYCIDKYYFNKNVKEVKPPIRTLRPLYYLKGRKKVEKLLESRDNIIDQLKLLREYKGTKFVDIYIEDYLELWSNEYEAYCIKKYYYDMDVQEVEPTAKTLNITLYKIFFKDIEEKQEKVKQKAYMKAIKNAKKGDKVKILDGPFENQFGILDSFDKDNLKEGKFDIDAFHFEVIYTPGHTSDSVTYYFKDDKVMFTGDFVFKDSIGRCDLPTGDFRVMLNSIEKIKKYDDDIVIYPGHGEKSTLGYEKTNNEYFNLK